MVALMAFAAGVAVWQLALLGSWARSLRISTLLSAVAVGAVVCAPVTGAIQWLVTRGVAAAGSSPLSDVVNLAAWTYDPAIEEVVKIAPLALLAWLWPRVHRQLGWTDHLLLGSALGMGLALCEAALRYGRVSALAMSIPGGYAVRLGLFGEVVVPSVGSSLTSWQPVPTFTGSSGAGRRRRDAGTR